MKKCVIPALIGLRKDDPTLVSFMREIPSAPQHDEFGGLKIEHFPAEGLSLYFDESERITSVFLFSGRTKDGSRYAGPLPEGLSFDHGRREAQLMMGDAERAGADWDRFERDGRVIHLRYADGGVSVALINVFSADRK